MKVFEIPTGYLFTDEYTRGELETLSIGDYGRQHNVKADFLGYTDEINGVPNGACMPLSEKWVVTLSTQYGCPMSCNFCDVPNVKFKGNATEEDMRQQLIGAISLFPDVRYTERLNIHFARMGEPSFNADVFSFTRWLWGTGKRYIQEVLNLRAEVIHPVFTTMCPRACKELQTRIIEWCCIKNDLFMGQAGLQLSINSTSEAQRSEMFSGMQLTLDEIASMCELLPQPLGRKYCLNFAYSSGYEIDAVKLASMFDQNSFMVKITPIHNNNACRANGIETLGGYHSWAPYDDAERRLQESGWDVIVFIPSHDEEDGLVTCGNAVLGGGVVRSVCNN